MLNQDGIFSRAEDATTEQRGGTVQDEVTIWKNEKQMAKYDGVPTKLRDELIENQNSRGLLTEEEAKTAKETGKVKIGMRTIYYGDAEIPIQKETSYVGYYADIEGDGKVDGIIYADLAVGGEGMWNDNSCSNYKYDSINEGLKEYYVSKTDYEGPFKTGDVLTPIDVGKDRFYIMALEDIKNKEHDDLFCWYYAAYERLDKIVSLNTNDFGSGKENTSYVMKKWDLEEWGMKNSEGAFDDLWGTIKGEVAKGWFLPSKSEWSAFGDMLHTKYGMTAENYYLQFGISDWYWSSSQSNSTCAYLVNFYSGVIDSGDIYTNNVTSRNSVRLSTTF